MGDRDHSIECETCGDASGGMNDLICSCDPDGVMALHDLGVALYWLASNIEDAAMLCRAYNMGDDSGYAKCPCDSYWSDEDYDAHDARFWSPGCGRPAP